MSEVSIKENKCILDKQLKPKASAIQNCPYIKYCERLKDLALLLAEVSNKTEHIANDQSLYLLSGGLL